MTKGDRYAVRLRHGWNGALVTLVVGTSAGAAIFAVVGATFHAVPDAFQGPVDDRMRILWIPGLCVSLSMALFAAATATGVLPLARLRIVGRRVRISHRSGFRRVSATLDLRDLTVRPERAPYPIRPGRDPLELTVLVFDDGVRSARVETVARVSPDVVAAAAEWIESHRSDRGAAAGRPGG